MERATLAGRLACRCHFDLHSSISRSTTTLCQMTTVMRWRSRTLFAAACMAGLVFLLFRKSGKDTMTLNLFPMHGAARSSTLPCLDLPGAGDAVVVLRTGSTELQDKLPVHLSTTLQCYPNYLVFSDYEETYHGETIVDVLSSVSKQILDDHPDFELYRRLKRLGRSALLASELSSAESEAIQWHGKTQNPGWKLDKWKFLPMVNRTFSEFPDKKWYIFVEADSFIFWRSTLQYLALMDHTKPHYSGSQMFIGDVLFAHGGSGFFVSLPAMRMVVDYHASHQEKIEKFTDGHWAGDCVLGKVFKDAGVHFTNSWPIFQGDYPGIVPYAKPDDRPVADVKTRVWCYPTISYHHLSPEIVEDLWYFEQRWFKSNPMVRLLQ